MNFIIGRKIFFRMSQPGTTLGNQTLIFDEVYWIDDPPPFSGFTMDTDKPVAGVPMKLSVGGSLGSEASHPPYWEFAWQLNHTVGLKLTNVNVRDSQSAGSTENVFDTIDFTDFSVSFDGGPTVPFDLAAAFANPKSNFTIREGGTRTIAGKPPDALFQRGMKLTLVNDVLSGSDTCIVKLELSVVFRGANNDIDPGGIPVGMKVWPQFAWTWLNTDDNKATKKVTSFRGSVRCTVNNQMYTMGGMSGMSASGNVSSVFTDSNNSMRGNQRGNILTGHSLKNTGAVIGGVPIGWALVFDYATPDLSKEIQVMAVGAVYPRTARHYIWPDPSVLGSTTISSGDIELDKAPRQAWYDNMHIHARMSTNDAEGNVQVHAPFCGHSCLHTHWRWSSLSSNGATGGRGWAFRGWGTGPGATAWSTDNAPMVPPNQIIFVSLCRRNATRASNGTIFNPGSPGALDPLYKMIWYEVTINTPNANEKQVVMDHGMGWAYRYTIPTENNTILKLFALIHTFRVVMLGSIFAPSTQQEVADFFEKDVYPFFRYIDGVTDRSGKAINQVPTGDYNKTFPAADSLAMTLA